MFDGIFAPMHLLVILFIVLIIFGPGKLPEIGQGLGKAIKSFKGEMKDLKEDINANSIDHNEKKAA